MVQVRLKVGAQVKGPQLDPRSPPLPSQTVGEAFCRSAPGCSLGLFRELWGLGVGRNGELGSRQQVLLLTALTVCQSPLRSIAHLCSSVGGQMGPRLVFLASVRLGG